MLWVRTNRYLMLRFQELHHVFVVGRVLFDFVYNSGHANDSFTFAQLIVIDDSLSLRWRDVVCCLEVRVIPVELGRVCQEWLLNTRPGIKLGHTVFVGLRTFLRLGRIFPRLIMALFFIFAELHPFVGLVVQAHRFRDHSLGCVLFGGNLCALTLIFLIVLV